MALFSECMPWCARKGLDTADIVRDAIYRHLLAGAAEQSLPQAEKPPGRGGFT